MESKDRIKMAINHREADRIPLDIGGTRISGIHIEAYQALRKFYKLPPVRPEIFVRYLQLARIDEDSRSFFKVDLESVNPNFWSEDGESENMGNGRYYLDRWNCGWYKPEGGVRGIT